jgi:hypothetical protein
MSADADAAPFVSKTTEEKTGFISKFANMFGM